MEVAIIEHFIGHGFEVWITDIIEIGCGMGDIFPTYEEALTYAKDQNLPIVDISHIELSFMESDKLRIFLNQFLELKSNGIITGIKKVS